MEKGTYHLTRVIFFCLYLWGAIVCVFDQGKGNECGCDYGKFGMPNMKFIWDVLHETFESDTK